MIVVRILKVKRFLLCSIGSFLFTLSLLGQEPYCQNLGFEKGDFTNWTGYNWIYSSEVPSINTSKVQVSLPTPRRQVIISDVNAYDPNTGNQLKEVPPGYQYSARLGDVIVNGDPNPRCWQQSLRYTMKVDSSNALLVMKFALVLQYISDHKTIEEPRFKLTLFDQKNDTIRDCANYDVYSSNGYVKGFQSYSPAGSNIPVEWRDWTTVGANLLKYYGQTITVEFMAADCTKKYHYGYAYFVAACHPLYITVKYCAGDSVATLTAPEGFERYRWIKNSGAVVDTTQVLSIPNPEEGAIYSCNMTSATGCSVTLKSIIAKYIIHADYKTAMVDCKSNIVQFSNLSTSSRGVLNYLWDFGDGHTSMEVNPAYTFTTSGLHDVILTLMNPPSACTEKLVRKIESFSPPLVGISGYPTYCPGQYVYLKAYGAYRYHWSTGATLDSIKVGDPGGRYWLLGHSSTGCVSDSIYKTVTRDPDWIFDNQSDTILCDGFRVHLKVSGAASYSWNTGAKTDTISVTGPGSYKVTGLNARGCEKTRTIFVKDYSLPGIDFTVSSPTIDQRHRQITFSTSPIQGVNYSWNFGDGSAGSGSSIQHIYFISNDIQSYLIKLKAVSLFGCEQSTSTIVDVIPFIPNVFTPNGDGINDLFMPKVDLRIFDRYGITLYEGKSGWDGTYHGKALAPDTYFYALEYTDKNQVRQSIKGYITLVR